MIKKVILGTCLAISLFSTTAFAHEGVVIKNFQIKNKDNEIVKELNMNDTVTIFREDEDNYILKLDDNNYEVSKDYILKTVHTENYYTVTSETATLKTEPNMYSPSIKKLNKGDILYFIEESDGWARVSTVETIEGWAYLPYLEHHYEEIEVDSVGYSLVDKVHKEKDKVLILNKGDTLNIVEFKDDRYVVTDDRDVAFEIPSSYLSLNDKYKSDKKTSSSGESLGQLIEFLYAQIGKPYVWGATGYNSYDCSGLSQTAYKQIGISIPRVASAQSRYGKKVDKSDLRPGDLVFFNTDGSGVSHVGVYIGEGQMIHAPSRGKTVSVVSINSNYYLKRYMGARRVL